MNQQQINEIKVEYTEVKLRKRHSDKTVTMVMPSGEFRFSKSTTKELNLDPNKKSLMFYLNRKRKTVTIKLENKDVDNYHLSNRDNCFIFTKKKLAIALSEAFGLENNKRHVFSFSRIGDEFLMVLNTGIAN